MSVFLSTGRPSAAVRAVVVGLDLLSSSCCSSQDWTTRWFARSQFYLRRAAFLRLEEGLLQHVVQILHDGDEDAEVVHRLDQFAYRAQGLQARVEVDAFLSPRLFEDFPARKTVVPMTTRCPDPLYC